MLKSNSIVDETLEDSDPASLGAGEEQVEVFVDPKPESQNISFSRISLGRESKPSEEDSKLEEDWITRREEVLLKEEVEELSLNCCCVEEEVEEVEVLATGAARGASVSVAPSFLGARIVSTPSLDSAVDTWSRSAAGGSVNSL